MSAIIITALTLLAFGFALYPLFREERWAYAPEEGIDPRLENLLSAREATYSAIKDLESDHAQGKLSDTDYQSTRAKYENKALLILQRLNLLETNAAVRAKRAERACAQCGEPYNVEHKFCRRCGAQLGAPTCANCGAAIQSGWKFCKQCGVNLAAPACANCGAAIQADWKFCKKCGAPVAALQPA